LQAENLFAQDVSYYQQVLRHCVQAPLAQNQYDALLSLAFSLGPEAIQLSPIVHYVNRGKYQEALTFWQVDAQQQNSLAIQRQAELALFQTDMR
jgi:GH24 family phage-related lysozyme (muramidase)